MTVARLAKVNIPQWGPSAKSIERVPPQKQQAQLNTWCFNIAINKFNHLYREMAKRNSLACATRVRPARVSAFQASNVMWNLSLSRLYVT